LTVEAYCDDVVSAVRRLLDELSWEGNARKYRNGGVGLENVITTEVFQAVDFLPRQAFLGRVLASASGASMAQARGDVEQLSVDLLPGNLAHPDDNGDESSCRAVSRIANTVAEAIHVHA
jgi:hypothetical protein